MSIAWGEFEDMAVHYLRELAKRGSETPMLICKLHEPVYGVCTDVEYAELLEKDESYMYRPVCEASPDEFMGLLFTRYLDFAKEESDGAEKKDISTREQLGGESPVVDAGGDLGSEGGRSEDSGGREEEDNNRKVQ